MPSDHSRRLDDRETLRPPRPHAGDHDPKRTVDWPEPRPRSCATKNRKLLAEQEVLRNQARTGPQCRAQPAENGLKDREHRGEVRAGLGPCHPRIAPADAVCWTLARHAVRLKESCENAFFVTTPLQVPAVEACRACRPRQGCSSILRGADSFHTGNGINEPRTSFRLPDQQRTIFGSPLKPCGDRK